VGRARARARAWALALAQHSLHMLKEELKVELKVRAPGSLPFQAHLLAARARRRHSARARRRLSARAAALRALALAQHSLHMLKELKVELKARGPGSLPFQAHLSAAAAWARRRRSAQELRHLGPGIPLPLALAESHA
jgi:hypothetical protein